jgi:hypothetical protein
MNGLPAKLLRICRWKRGDGAVLSLFRDGTLWMQEPGEKRAKMMVCNRRYNPAEADEVACKFKFPRRAAV